MNNIISLKFTNFYIHGDATLHDIEELVSLSDNEYRMSYKDRMICPCCKEAKLMFVRTKKGYYLKTSPNSKHTANCSYEVTSEKVKVKSEYLKEIDDTKILDEFIAWGMKKSENDNSSFNNKLNHTEKNIFTNYFENSISKKNSGEKKFNIHKIKLKNEDSLENIPKDELCIFYGKVKLFLHKEKYVLVKTINGSLITSFKKIDGMEIEDNHIYKISIIGKIHVHEDKNKIYKNIIIYKEVFRLSKLL